MTSPARRDFLSALVLPVFGFGPGRGRIAGIRFRVVTGRRDVTLLHIHGDETTAREVMEEIAPAAKATCYFVQSATRVVTVGGLRIDPNRMFSNEGAHRSLTRLNAGVSAARISNALRDLANSRERFVRRLLPRPGGLLVALHNNSRGYSIDTELPLSERQSIKPGQDRHDFMLATDPADFVRLEASPFNCVLQTAAPPPDDGSLSRLCARRGVRYVNIEAAMGHRGEQAAMLNWVVANLAGQTA